MSYFDNKFHTFQQQGLLPETFLPEFCSNSEENASELLKNLE